MSVKCKGLLGRHGGTLQKLGRANDALVKAICVYVCGGYTKSESGQKQAQILEEKHEGFKDTAVHNNGKDRKGYSEILSTKQ